MKAKRNLILCLLSTPTCLIGLAIFLRGFLLNRIELHDKTLPGHKNGQNCSILPFNRQRLILLLVDALGHDFIQRMPLLHTRISQEPDSWTSLKFIADPPTTTMQRLKALLTGSMPTFIDARSNFGAEQVLEDSLLYQWKQCNRTVYFSGDDTWIKLFPNGFTKTNGHPSFNVRDLDSVDEQVVKFIHQEISTGNFFIMIGHLLGIDHAGHTFGKFHPEMSRKITEIDTFISDLIEKLRSDDTLIIVGDHGMTNGGNHGGDSTEEVEAAILVYDKRGLTPLSQPTSISALSDQVSIHQVDLIPYLSFLAGTPIPFSNLGVLPIDKKIFPSVKYYLSMKDSYCSMNSQQMAKYSMKYLQHSFNENIAHKSINLSSQTPCIHITSNSLKELQSVYRENWTKMNLVDMLAGVGVLTIGLILQLATITNLEYPLIRVVISTTICLGALFIYNLTKNSWPLMTLGYCLCEFIYLIGKPLVMIDQRNLSVIPYLLTGLFFFGNSFLIQETVILTFILNSILLYRLINDLFQRRSLSFFKIFLMILIRYSQTFEVCREESVASSACQRLYDDDDDNNNPDIFIRKKIMYLLIAIIFSLFSLELYPVYFSLRKISLLNVSKGRLTWVRKFSDKLITVLLWLGWLLKILSELGTVRDAKNDQLISWLTNVNLDEYKIIYWKTRINQLCLLSVAFCVGSLYILWRKTWIPNVSLYPIILKLTIQLTLLILGPEKAVPLAFFLVFVSILVHCDIGDNLPATTIYCDVYLIGKLGFFILGHQRTITSIPWLSVFTFYNESPKSVLIPGLVVLINLIGSFILTLIVFYCIYKFRRLSLFSVEEKKSDKTHSDSIIDFSTLTKILVKFYTFNVLASIISLTILRRHLMVWKIFTPAFIYEFAFYILHMTIFLVTFIQGIIGQLLDLRSIGNS